MAGNTKSLLTTEEFYILDTRTISNSFKGRQIEYKDLTKNVEYATLLKKEQEGSLAEMFPHLSVREVNRSATNFHSQRMLNDPACKVEEVCDEDGLMFFHKAHKDEMVKLWKSLLLIDKDVKLSKYGKQLTPKELEVVFPPAKSAEKK